jgi:alcohol dehydrogenase class IV
VSGLEPLTIDPTCRIEFGPGVVGRLPDFVTATGFDRAFVVTDKGLRAAGLVDKVLKGLEVVGMEYDVYDGVSPNPSTENVDEGAAAVRSFGAAAVVALGGGSALDAAKGIALLAATGPRRPRTRTPCGTRPTGCRSSPCPRRPGQEPKPTASASSRTRARAARST